MNKIIYRTLSVILAFAMTLGVFYGAGASSPTSSSQQDQGQVYYVSPSGSDTNSGLITSPFRTIQKALTKVTAGGEITLLTGSYTEQMIVTANGTEGNPITISGSDATFNGGRLVLKNSNWLVLENLVFKGATNQITLQGSHYISIKNSSFDYVTRGIYIQEYSSHILIDGNEFYQSCAAGKTWTQLKGSTCEGGAVYGSSYGGGTYHIRNNWVHDAFNGFLFVDETAGQWMNSNVFIYSNRFERISDDPVEPEGDSFNFHVYGNTMIDTHRLASLTTKGLGPVFVYNNIQITNGNPTNETSRENSAFKIDLSGGFTNGVWIFNNTISGENAANFSAFDMLSRTIGSPLFVRNNIYVTKLNAFNETPSGGSIDYDMSKAPFGMSQTNGILGDALLLPDGKLNSSSKAIGKASQVSIPTWFVSSLVVKGGANLGAFQSIPAPAWVMPPNYPSQIPANVNEWPNNTVSAATITPNTSVTPTSVPVLPTATLAPTLMFVPTFTSTTTLPAIVPSTTPVAQSSSEKIFDDKDGMFSYSRGWENVTKGKAYGSSYKETSQSNASVNFTFTGESLSILYTGGPSFRKIEVYLDSTLVGTINERMNSNTFQQRWDYRGVLTPAIHTVQLVFISGQGRGTFDAVIIHSASNTSILLPANQNIVQTSTSMPTPISTQTASPIFVSPTETPVPIPPIIIPSETLLPDSSTLTPTSTNTP